MLLRIAICEDDAHDLSDLVLLLQSWAKEQGHTLEYAAFSDSTKLLGAIDEAYGRYDLYLLDIEMHRPEEGLELARAIRRVDEHLPLVFITSHRELAFDSFDVSAFGFVGKPISERRNSERLVNALDRLIRAREQQETVYFTCTTESRVLRLPLYDIRYFCTCSRDSHYLLINGEEELRFRRRLGDIQREYPDALCSIHQSYLVNLEHVISLRAQTLLLSDGEELPISRGELQQVRQRFAAYQRGRGSAS